MTSINDGFQRRGLVNVTPSALAFARAFAEATGQIQGGTQIVAFYWASSMIERAPGQPDDELGPCLSLGAYRRDEVPIEARDFKSGFEFAVKISDEVLAQSVLKLIDVDETKPFNIALR